MIFFPQLLDHSWIAVCCEATSSSLQWTTYSGVYSLSRSFGRHARDIGNKVIAFVCADVDGNHSISYYIAAVLLSTVLTSMFGHKKLAGHGAANTAPSIDRQASIFTMTDAKYESRCMADQD